MADKTVTLTPEEVEKKSKELAELKAQIQAADHVPQSVLDKLEGLETGLASLKKKVDDGETEIIPETDEEKAAAAAAAAATGGWWNNVRKWADDCFAE